MHADAVKEQKLFLETEIEIELPIRQQNCEDRNYRSKYRKCRINGKWNRKVETEKNETDM
jgi:hypothetical protein